MRLRAFLNLHVCCCIMEMTEKFQHEKHSVMTSITRNLPWFIQDLGVSILGQVSKYFFTPYTALKKELGMLHVTR